MAAVLKGEHQTITHHKAGLNHQLRFLIAIAMRVVEWAREVFPRKRTLKRGQREIRHWMYAGCLPSRHTTCADLSIGYSIGRTHSSRMLARNFINVNCEFNPSERSILSLESCVMLLITLHKSMDRTTARHGARTRRGGNEKYTHKKYQQRVGRCTQCPRSSI